MLPKMAEALHNYYYFPFAAVEVAVAETHYQVKEGFEARVCVTLISENSGCVVPSHHRRKRYFCPEMLHTW